MGNDFASDLMILGMIFSCASGLLYQYRLFEFGRFLKARCPRIWYQHIDLNGSASALVKYNRLHRLPLEFNSDNDVISQKLRALVLIQRSVAIGWIVLLVGLCMVAWQVLMG